MRFDCNLVTQRNETWIVRGFTPCDLACDQMFVERLGIVDVGPEPVIAEILELGRLLDRQTVYRGVIKRLCEFPQEGFLRFTDCHAHPLSA
ncbi:hypothetical protein QE435_001284 [Rhizobium sp. SORGH_AS 787]|nr:hypothetical protein [Rhizobium sp. SORGH_AS_0787]